MSDRFSRAAATVLLCCVATAGASADTAWSPARASHSIDQEIAAAPLRGSHLGILVTELPSGRIVYAHNADDAFTPASTLKLLTGVTALEVLGRDARFTTTVALRGVADGARFNGDVIVHGGGDPLLSRGDLAEAARAIAQRGLTQISGTIRVQSRIVEPAPYPQGWLIDDMPFDYAAPVAGTVLDENALNAHVAAASFVGGHPSLTLAPRDAQTLHELGLSLQNTADTSAAASEDTLAAAWGPAMLGIAGSMPLHSASEDIGIAVPDPQAFIQVTMRHDLAQLGVSTGTVISHVVADDERTVWQHRSPVLTEIVRSMWLQSDNVIAETLLEQIGYAIHPGGDVRERGIARELQMLRSVDVDTNRINIVDGSGLSRYDLTTPAMNARIFAHVWGGPLRAVLLASLPLSGTRGTLRNAFRLAPLAGAYYAKTGGMRNVANMTGVLHTQAHGWLSVTMFADDAPIEDAALRALQTKILMAAFQGQ